MKIRALLILVLAPWCLWAQTTSPNIGLTLPTHSQQNWDVPLNSDFTIIDAILGGQVPIPAINPNLLYIGTDPALNTSASTGTGALVRQGSPQIQNPNIYNATLNGNTAINGTLGLSGLISSCTSSNTDTCGKLTCSGGTASWTFQGGPYQNAPMCFPQDLTAHSVPTFSVNTTALSISSCSTDSIQYFCVGGQQAATPVTTYAAETANNTASCTNDPGGSGFIPSYCTAAFAGFSTASANTTAQTTVVQPPAGHISQMSIHTLLYSGWNGRVICAYQPWFSTKAPSYNGHKFIGYSENSSAVIQAQHDEMIRAGCDIVSPDWYGTHSSQAYNQATVVAQAADLAARPGYPLKMLIMLDKGALKAFCPAGTTDQTTCLTTNGNALFDYINTNWANKPYYATTAAGNPIVTTFIIEGDWGGGTNWTTIMSAWAAHVAAYAKPFKLVKEFGNFTESGYDGAYGWPQPPDWSNSNQLCWDSITCGTSYANTFYTAALANPSKIAIGALYKGFDDNNASWGGNRVIAQQCGQVLLNTAAKPASNGYSTSTQIPFMQVATWNDYEEGSGVEDGIDNCYRPSISLSTDTITIALNATDGTYATTNTIDHWTVWYRDAAQNLFLAQDNLARGTTTVNLSTLVPTGTYDVCVEMVGKALMTNRMTNCVTYTH